MRIEYRRDQSDNAFFLKTDGCRETTPA